MVKRSTENRALLWLCSAAPATVLLFSHAETLPFRLVSLAAWLPALFLVTGWPYSSSRKGIRALVERSDISGTVTAAEVLLPGLSGTVLCSLTALLAGNTVPWQFWIIAPLFSFSTAMLLLAVEQKLQNPGRFVLLLLWMAGLSGKLSFKPLIFTEYPGTVIETSLTQGGTHPDTFILLAILLLGISGSLWYLSKRYSS